MFEMLAEHSKKSSEFQGFKFISTSEIPKFLLEQMLPRIKGRGLWEVAYGADICIHIHIPSNNANRYMCMVIRCM